MSTSYKRAYKACEACRRTKAKCELDAGAVTCLKCQREQRECRFPTHRSAKRARISEDVHMQTKTNSTARTKKSRANRTSEERRATAEHVDVAPSSNPTSKVLPHSRQPFLSDIEPQSDPLDNNLGHDLNTRENNFQSARPSSSLDHQQVRQPDGTPEGADQTAHAPINLQSDVIQTFVTSSSDAIGLLFRAAEQNDSESSEDHTNWNYPLQDEHQGSVYSMPSPALASNETLNLWAQHRFVRQGWFTEREAISYIEFFFKNLSPLSPVADSYYADHKNHKRLILEEPLLCCTILMISSRHHIPSKGGGGKARADFVHNRLWRHIEHLIQKITFGAEKYSLAKTRTLGSIQALLLIVEWHPRALHFPPETDGWDASLAPSIDDTYQQQHNNSDASKRWREDVFEPAKRSDRLSWMLVGLATTLAHELGVFSHIEVEKGSADEGVRHLTMARIRRLLFLYVSQLSLRLGCTSIFPHSSQHNISHAPSSALLAEGQATEDRDLLTSKWIDITKLSTTAAEMMFTSPSTTAQMFKNFRYANLLEHFQPLLHRWYADFESMTCHTVSAAARDILLIEYHFVCMYINSVAVQALVERARSYNSSNVFLDQDFLSSEFSHDFRFVKEVRDSSLEILRLATKLSADDILQYCPVRVFLRIVAASIYLLKTISLGSREADVTRSLVQLQRCIEALRKSNADDIHLSGRYATLIARHVRQFKRNFRVRKSNPNLNAAASRAASHDQDVRGRTGNTINTVVETNLNGQMQAAANTTLPLQNDSGVASLTNDSTLMFDFDGNGLIEDWLAQPFDLQCAPFGFDGAPPTSGLAVDSLDFLWKISV